MNILIICDVYPPEISSAALLMQELAQWLDKHNHNVAVATSYPKHYLDSETKEKTFGTLTNENNIRVIRIKTLPLHKTNFIIRGISQLLLPSLFFNKIKKVIKGRVDMTIVYSPPLTLGIVGKKVKRCYKAKFILNIQDLFPQNAIDLGILKNKFLIKFFELMEQKVYQNADKITFHSEGGRRFLIDKKRVPSEKIITLPNWIDLKQFQNLFEDISYRKQYNLENKFIFLFAGIMGPAQGLDFLIKVAREVADIKDIVFLLVGDGTEKEKIEKMIKEYSLANVVIKPFVAKEKYPYLVKDVDVGIVCLGSKNKTPFVPGKFLGYLAAGKPVVAFLNKESDGFALIKKAGCGYAARANDLEQAVNIVRKIYKERNNLEHLGRNGFKYALHNLTIDICLKKLEELF